MLFRGLYYNNSQLSHCSDEAGALLSSWATATIPVSGCELSALTAEAACVVMTTRSARLLPNTNPDWLEDDDPVEVVATVVLVETDYKYTIHNWRISVLSATNLFHSLIILPPIYRSCLRTYRNVTELKTIMIVLLLVMVVTITTDLSILQTDAPTSTSVFRDGLYPQMPIVHSADKHSSHSNTELYFLVMAN